MFCAMVDSLIFVYLIKAEVGNESLLKYNILITIFFWGGGVALEGGLGGQDGRIN